MLNNQHLPQRMLLNHSGLHEYKEHKDRKNPVPNPCSPVYFSTIANNVK